jgi:hypothetical protein
MIADPTKTYMAKHEYARMFLFLFLCVTPGGQEHDPPDGVLGRGGGGRAPAVITMAWLGCRRDGH